MTETKNNTETVANEKTPGLAIASLVSGIISIIGGVFLLLPPILAIIFGHISRSDIKKKNSKAGLGIALAGLIMGYLSFVPVPLGIMAAIAIPSVVAVKESSQEKMIMNNLQMISAAADQYFLTNNTTTVELEQLVGEGKYIKTLEIVDEESYPTIIYQTNTEITAHRINNEDVILNVQ